MGRSTRRDYQRRLDYREAILNTPGLVSYWRLGEKAGTVARDECGRSNGTYVGGPTLGVAGLLTGDANTAVTFDETDDWVSVPDAAFRFGGDFSVSMLVTPSASATGLNGGISRFYNTNGNRAWRVGFDATWGPTGQLSADGTASTAKGASSVLATGVPSHVAWVYRAASGAMDFYINGSFVSTGTGLPTSIFTGAIQGNKIGIGSWDVGATGINLFKGIIDEPAIWSRALAAAEVANRYRIGKGY
jgi:hypothetical protein